MRNRGKYKNPPEEEIPSRTERRDGVTLGVQAEEEEEAADRLVFFVIIIIIRNREGHTLR